MTIWKGEEASGKSIIADHFDFVSPTLGSS